MALALIAPTAFAADTPICPEGAAPPAPVCLATAHGLAYADTQADAQMAAEAIESATAQFRGTFGRTLPPGMLVLSSTFDGDQAKRFARDHNLGFWQVWLSPADKRAQVEAVMRRANPNPDADRVAQVLGHLQAQHLNALRHELGHAQYRAAYWADAESVDGQYGTPAPDWLDEAAAVRMEGQAARAQYEHSFFTALRTASPAILPLAQFLAQTHPIVAQRQALMQSSGVQTPSGIQVMTMSGDGALAAGLFYAQSMLFADFLEQSSPQPHILGAISEAIAAGADFESWLADTGAAYGLPGDIAGLQTAWDAWCMAHPGGAHAPAG
ncbi:hypothetical protein MNO14_04640 [Luteimonas sp. S4-F44]|uniref:hypothetical protein n=1 Tax=Luteimonas sp. S4-F44 TaxID=2925842 RepID=UPI001F53D1AD|nr:hypothetical protein [Luteimonas sp. S4-F44]UNK43378.1 hypothetical protein MNO14_04640 [Luteimonas sp. S4-F44]